MQAVLLRKETVSLFLITLVILIHTGLLRCIPVPGKTFRPEVRYGSIICTELGW